MKAGENFENFIQKFKQMANQTEKDKNYFVRVNRHEIEGQRIDRNLPLKEFYDSTIAIYNYEDMEDKQDVDIIWVQIQHASKS